MRYFYNTKTKLHIVDISGKKTIKEIAKDYGGKLPDYQTIDMTATEEETKVASIVNGNLAAKNNVAPHNYKSDYSKLSTAPERIAFLAERLGLK